MPNVEGECRIGALHARVYELFFNRGHFSHTNKYLSLLANLGPKFALLVAVVPLGFSVHGVHYYYY
jgi:hypothetical protein